MAGMLYGCWIDTGRGACYLTGIGLSGGGARAGRRRIDARRGAYKIYYENLQKLWRDFYTVETHFTGDLDLACTHEAVIVGSATAAAGRMVR